MKRTILIVCVFALLCTVLCGCGSGRGDGMAQQSPSVTIELIPEVSPAVSMDPNDGYVRDDDGLIDEHDTGTPGVTVSTAPAPGVSPSAGPQQSAKP